MDKDEYAENEDAFVRHLDSLGVPHPYETRDPHRIGLDRNTEEGALVAFSSALRPANPVHRAVAWALLASFGIPALLTLLLVVRELLRLLLP